MVIKAQKGTKDILPETSAKWQFMEETALELFKNANCKEIRTPIFEATELFARGVGDSTDIVNKEMYTFTQKDRSITLRPENTAGVVRAFIENGMSRMPSPVKLWYKGPMFRYERPQAGRQRQFHQLGLEFFGTEAPSADAEVILLAMNYLKELGIPNLTLEINSLGCPKCRTAYRDSIKKVIAPLLDKFCPDCTVRYEKNPLRILDCKFPECQELLQSAKIQEVIKSDYICEDCATHFETLQDYLKASNIDFTINKLLVRGLDYYNRTVFEIKSNSLGSQNAVCGGGRYDSLVEILGGDSTPAIGWAMGMERLFAIMPEYSAIPITAFIVSNNTKEALLLANILRNKGISVDYDANNRKFVKQIDKAAKIFAKYAIILGEDEIKNNYITLKNLEIAEQSKETLETLVETLIK